MSCYFKDLDSELDFGVVCKKQDGLRNDKQEKEERISEGLGELLLFEGEGEFFPFGEKGDALGAEGFQFGGVFLGLLGGGEVAEAAFGGGDGGFEARDFGFGVVETVFELFQFDGVQALDGSWWLNAVENFGNTSTFGLPRGKDEKVATRVGGSASCSWSSSRDFC
jgi:hypothetical protein